MRISAHVSRIAIVSLAILAANQACALAAAAAKEPAVDPFVGNEAGQVRDDNGISLKLVWCPPGALTMEQVETIEALETSDDKSRPQVRRIEKSIPIRASLSRGFWVGKYEVTQNEWQRVMGTSPWKESSRYVAEGDDFAASCINWFDAMEFCGKLTRQEQAAGRLPADWEFTLPSEAQWEYACRAGSNTRFSFGDDPEGFAASAWFFDNTSQVGKRYVHRVGQKQGNAWGLYDMHGNAIEWCRDAFAPTLPGGADPEMKPTTEHWRRSLRGGCFNSESDSCRSAGRDSLSPIPRGNCIGFRVALCRGDIDSTEARVKQDRETFRALQIRPGSEPALHAAARKAGALPCDSPEAVEAILRIDFLDGRIRRGFDQRDAPIIAVEIQFSDRIRVEDLRLLRALPSVQELYLNSSSVTDAGLEEIAALTGINVLGLGHTKIADTGLKALASLTHLRELYLTGTKISDAGLAHLAPLKELRTLYLGETLVTDAGVRQLAAFDSLTNLEIDLTAITEEGRKELKIGRPDLTLVRSMVEPTDEVPALVGKLSEKWTTTDLDGKSHSLEDYRGKVVILDFWYRDCPWCLRAMPQVNEVARHFEGQPVVVLGMTTDLKESDALWVVRRTNLKYPVLNASEISLKYSIESFPTLLVIDQKGTIRDVHVGYSPTLRDDVVDAVTDLLRPGR